MCHHEHAAHCLKPTRTCYASCTHSRSRPHLAFLAAFSPAAIALSAFLRQSGTAFVQLSAALRFGDLITISSLSMMQGGTASEHFFKQTFAGALPQRCSYTAVGSMPSQ